MAVDSYTLDPVLAARSKCNLVVQTHVMWVRSCRKLGTAGGGRSQVARAATTKLLRSLIENMKYIVVHFQTIN